MEALTAGNEVRMVQYRPPMERQLVQSFPKQMASASRYWIVSLPAQNSHSAPWSGLKETISKHAFDTPVYRFNVPDLRVGTLDSLLSLSNDLVKSNTFIEVVSHKIRRQIEDLERVSGVEVGALTVDGVPVDSYLTRFVWDDAKYPTMSPLREIVDSIHVQVAKIEDDMKIIQEITGFGEAGRSCGMMLRKRSRPSQKDQSKMADSASDPGFSCESMMQKGRSTSFFSVPRLFVGFSTKGLSDSDSARSPTSPLDFKVFSNLGTPFVRSPRSPGLDSPRKSWDCNRVGLGLVDSLNDETSPYSKVLGLFKQ